MNYEEMSDGEITWRVHHIVNNVQEGHATICVADYCNNPSDAWSIIFENRITISPCSYKLNSGLWIASEEDYVNGVSSMDKNPLRAAMICFLKMKDSQHD